MLLIALWTLIEFMRELNPKNLERGGMVFLLMNYAYVIIFFIVLSAIQYDNVNF